MLTDEPSRHPQEEKGGKGWQKTEDRNLRHHTKLGGKWSWEREYERILLYLNSIPQWSQRSTQQATLLSNQSQTDTSIGDPHSDSTELWTADGVLQQAHCILMNTAAQLQREARTKDSYDKHETVLARTLPICFHPSSAAQAGLPPPVILLPQLRKCRDGEDGKHQSPCLAAHPNC